MTLLSGISEVLLDISEYFPGNPKGNPSQV